MSGGESASPVHPESADVTGYPVNVFPKQHHTLLVHQQLYARIYYNTQHGLKDHVKVAK